MSQSLNSIHVHLVSDATGETTHQLARAALAQFTNVETIEHVWTLVRTEEHLIGIEDAIKKYGGVVLFSLADRIIRSKLEQICDRYNIPYVAVLDHAVHTLSKLLGPPSEGITAGQYVMDEAYFDRMEALEFTIRHDDGQGLNSVKGADILIVGISRSSKTPTSIYLAHRGYKVGNYPLVPGVPMPIEEMDLKNVFVVGLVRDARSLAQIRRNRLVSMNENEGSDYADQEQIMQELKEARQLFNVHKWPVIDVSRRSVEETAAAIINLHTRWLEDSNSHKEN